MDTKQDIRDHPIKAAIYFTTLGATGYFIKTNPSEENFHEHLMDYRNDLATVGEPIRNPTSDFYLQAIMGYANAGVLRYTNVGVCSVMWVDNFDPQVDLFEAHCKSIKVGWLEWKDKVVDIGVLGRWRLMDQAMIDYDINPHEWRDTHASNK